MSDKIWVDGGGWTSPKDYIDEVSDFPQNGISFKDISPLLANSKLFKEIIVNMGNLLSKVADYWIGLVDEDSITVQLTAIGKKQDLWVKDIENNRVFVGSSTNQVKCFYFIQAERKDVEKLIVEV